MEAAIDIDTILKITHLSHFQWRELSYLTISLFQVTILNNF